MTPSLTVIMPVYNAAPYVGEAIESILTQTYGGFELIIADDGSTDDSRESIQGYRDQRIIISHNSNNLGKTATVNRLFRMASGYYVTIHDADDISEPSRFEIQLKKMRSDPMMVFCGSNFSVVNTSGNLLGTSNLNVNDSDLREGLFLRSQFHGPTVIFKREAAMKLDEIYRPFFRDYNEDYDFLFRLSEFGTMANCSEVLYKYRITQSSLSRKLTVQKRVSVKLVQYLARQRQINGTDDIVCGRIDSLERKLEELAEPYNQDKSLIFREQAELDTYYGFYRDGLRSALRAVRTAPTVLKNYRLVQHIIRKRILGF